MPGAIYEIAAGGVGLGEFLHPRLRPELGRLFTARQVALHRLSPLVSVSYSAMAGTLVLAVPALREGLTQTIGRVSLLDWTSMAYLAILRTVIGFVWFYEGVNFVARAGKALFINFVPISAVILAFFMLREPITWSLAVGAVLVLSGVYLTNRMVKR